jgi:hypothetical protein
MLTCKGADFVWENTEDRAFKELKARLTERPLLAIYSVDAETEVHILFQKQEGNWKPVDYFSRQMTKEEQHYTLTKLKHLRLFKR